MALIFRATRGLQWLGQWAATPRGGANPQTQSKSGLRAETRPHEAGMPSNRMSQISIVNVMAFNIYRINTYAVNIWKTRHVDYI